MSKLFGPVVQQGYVVPDIDEAMQHWIARGVGPFYIEKHISPACEINGEKAKVDISAAFAYSGDQQIEVIVQHNDVPTIYKQYLDKQPEGGCSIWPSGATISTKSWLRLATAGLCTNAMVMVTHTSTTKKLPEP